MILRDATAADAAALRTFDLGGQPSAWLDEVAEIVAGLVAWQHDDDLSDLDRRVIVADVDGAIVAVTAHERLEHDTLGPVVEHRYVMVVAVRADHRRSGVGTALLESVLAEMQREGVLTASWLVHPGNLASAAFSRTGFPEAAESTRRTTGHTRGSRSGSDAPPVTFDIAFLLSCTTPYLPEPKGTKTPSELGLLRVAPRITWVYF